MLSDILQRIRAHLWEREIVTAPQRRLIWLGRYVYALAHDLWEGQISMRAMSLVYTTLLSLVPLLALGFSVLKALGVHNSLEPALLEFLRPLGPQAESITQNIVGFVENIRVGVLGSVGVALLFYAAVSMIQKVESSFNYIWRIERGRPLSQRLGEYLTVLMVGPVLVFAALGITAKLMSSGFMADIAAIQPFGALIKGVTRLIPYVLMIGTFTFLYSFVPNTRVWIRAAFAGGLLAGVLWQSGSLVFASFVAGATNYNAIYSGFAILIFLLIWLYVGWLILLLGCALAFYVQHPEHIRPQRVPPMLSGRASEYLALLVMARIGRAFLRGERAPTRDDLVKAVDAPPSHVLRIVDNLIGHGLLAEAGPAGDQLMPALDLESLPLARLWRLARAGNAPMPRSGDPLTGDIRELLDRAEKNLEATVGELSVRQWLIQSERPS
jgi:membrane protein